MFMNGIFGIVCVVLAFIFFSNTQIIFLVLFPTVLKDYAILYVFFFSFFLLFTMY